jgi:hypothetical protein
LLPVATILWALGVRETDSSVIGPYGLPTLLPIVFYAGLGLLVVSAVVELVHDRVSSWRMALHAAVLTVMLYGTAPLVYSAGRYSWLYKTIGVVQYVNAHGQLNGSIDIYQNWPGFFALAAWLGKVAGVASPLAYAKWAQLLFELAALPLLYLIYDALALTARQRWVALLLVPASNWIGQDYFSPQAFGTLLYLGIMAVALRQLFMPAPAPNFLLGIRRTWSRLRRKPGQASPPPADLVSADGLKVLMTIADSQSQAKAPRLTGVTLRSCLVILVIFFALSMTHQLSPYMLAAQLGALALFRMLRPRWLPLVLLAMAIAYLVPHFSYVNTHYGLLNSLGNLFSNATPPALTRGQVAPSQQFIERCAEALSIGVWILAIVGAWRNRRVEKTAFALALLAFSPSVMLGLQAYGHEGVLRVFLFSLPWSAALAAMAIAPATRRASTNTTLQAERTASWARYLARDEVRAALALGIALALFIPAFFGDDSFNFMSQKEVDVVTAFFQNAAPGRVYFPLEDAPLADTSKYNLFPRTALFGSYGIMRKGTLTADVANVLAQDAASRSSAHTYLMITPSMVAFNDQYEVTPARNFAILRTSLTNSPLWNAVYYQGGIAIYQLLPISQEPGFGPAGGSASPASAGT